MFALRLLGVVLAVALGGCATESGRIAEAQALVDSNQSGKAEAVLLAMIAARDDNTDVAWHNLGAIYWKGGQRPRAIQAFTMSARYGLPAAQAKLVYAGYPVPAADLARRSESGGNGLAELANSVESYNRDRASRPAPAVAPDYYRAPSRVNCTSNRIGSSIDTTCTQR